MLMPQGEPRKASYAEDQKAIWREIRALWKTKNVPASLTASGSSSSISTGFGGMATFYFVGQPAASPQPPYQFRVATTLQEMAVTLGQVGSTSSTAILYLNGANIGSVVVAAGAKYDFLALNQIVVPTDVLTAIISGVGASAYDFTVQVSW